MKCLCVPLPYVISISLYMLQGCSAGIIAIDLAKNLLRGRPNSLALVVSTENLTQALYQGNDRAFLLQNTLFRCGEAILSPIP